MSESLEDDPGPAKKVVETSENKAIDNAPSKPTHHIEDDEAETEAALTQTQAEGETEPEYAMTAVAAVGDDAGLAPSGSERVVENAPASSKEIRALEKRNKELLVRIRELEFEQMSGYAQDVVHGTGPEDFSKGAPNIVVIVEDLAAKLDSALSMIQALEADLADAQSRLVKVSTAGDELRAHMQILEAKASLVQSLEDELAFVEEERAVTARLLEENEVQLDQITKARDALAEKLTAEEARNAQIALVKMNFESQLLNLGEDLHSARKELAQANDCVDKLMKQTKDLTGRLDSSETSGKAFELDAATSRDVASQLKQGLDEQHVKLDAVQTHFKELSDQLEAQQLDNRDLIQGNNILKREVNALSTKNETITVELDSAKKRLDEFYSAAHRIEFLSRRVHKRFYQDPEVEKD